ncbi:hypothetical protein GCM10010176_027220 [Nonomuraea spiralis]|nr:hypothetical protein GCM10010176_027220 [Nonomuraea spiralis]
MMADPDPEFFSVGVTLAALFWVSMLVESHLRADQLLLDRIASKRDELDSLRKLEADVERRTKEAASTLERRVRQLRELDAQLAEQLRRHGDERSKIAADLDAVNVRIARNIDESFRVLGDSTPVLADDRPDGSPFWRAMGKGILDRLGGVLGTRRGSGVPAGRESFVASRAWLVSLISRRSGVELREQWISRQRMLLRQNGRLFRRTARLAVDEQAVLGEIAKKVDFAALPPEERAAWSKVLTLLENLRENRRRASRIRTLAALREAEKRKLERLHRLRVLLGPWLPLVTCVAGGWTVLVALMALQGGVSPCPERGRGPGPAALPFRQVGEAGHRFPRDGHGSRPAGRRRGHHVPAGERGVTSWTFVVAAVVPDGLGGRGGCPPTRHVGCDFLIRPIYGVPCSRFGRPSRAVEARGNLVEIRDCPAAVSGNDRRQAHWAKGLGSDGQ